MPQNCPRVAEDPQSFKTSSTLGWALDKHNIMVPQLQEENMRGLERVSQNDIATKMEGNQRAAGSAQGRGEVERQRPNRINRKRRPERSVLFLSSFTRVNSALTLLWIALFCNGGISETGLPVHPSCVFFWWIESYLENLSENFLSSVGAP